MFVVSATEAVRSALLYELHCGAWHLQRQNFLMTIWKTPSVSPLCPKTLQGAKSRAEHQDKEASEVHLLRGLVDEATNSDWHAGGVFTDRPKWNLKNLSRQGRLQSPKSCGHVAFQGDRNYWRTCHLHKIMKFPSSKVSESKAKQCHLGHFNRIAMETPRGSRIWVTQVDPPHWVSSVPPAWNTRTSHSLSQHLRL